MSARDTPKRAATQALYGQRPNPPPGQPSRPERPNHACKVKRIYQAGFSFAKYDADYSRLFHYNQNPRHPNLFRAKLNTLDGLGPNEEL